MVSLELFSQKGFSAVSIRDICRRVQIKESSVYYYFPSKLAILEELLMRFEHIATSMMHQMEQALQDVNVLRDTGFQDTIGDYFYEKYWMDSFCNPVLRVILLEQFHSEEAQALYQRWMFAEPLAFQSKVFSLLMEKKLIQRADSDDLAIQYYAPIYLFAQRWLLSGTLTAERKQAFRADADHHTQRFFGTLMGEN